MIKNPFLNAIEKGGEEHEAQSNCFQQDHNFIGETCLVERMHVFHILGKQGEICGLNKGNWKKLCCFVPNKNPSDY